MNLQTDSQRFSLSVFGAARQCTKIYRFRSAALSSCNLCSKASACISPMPHDQACAVERHDMIRDTCYKVWGLVVLDILCKTAYVTCRTSLCQPSQTVTSFCAQLTSTHYSRSTEMTTQCTDNTVPPTSEAAPLHTVAVRLVAVFSC